MIDKACALEALSVDEVGCDNFVGSDLKNGRVESKKHTELSYNALVLKELLDHLRYYFWERIQHFR